MDVYLPVAEMAVNPWLMVGLGFFVGAMSGVFGVGGGFLMTPMLMLLGIPAPTAVVAGLMLQLPPPPPACSVISSGGALTCAWASSCRSAA